MVIADVEIRHFHEAVKAVAEGVAMDEEDFGSVIGIAAAAEVGASRGEEFLIDVLELFHEEVVG